MFRALCVAVALAMTPAGASAQAASGQAIPPGWASIETQGWTFVDFDHETLMFVRAARQPMHIWTRFESKTPLVEDKFSWRSLVQVDCSNWRRRTLNSSYYERNNLSGSAFLDDQPEDWIYPAPDSFGEVPLLVLCD